MEPEHSETEKQFGGTDAWNTPAHWQFSKIDLDFDVPGQMGEIRALILRNRKIEEELRQEYERLESDPTLDQEGLIRDGLAYDSRFQSTAHSLAAVGMLAPFLESVFYQCLCGIGRKLPIAHTLATAAMTHERWQSTQTMHWDCHNYVSNGRCRTDLVKGIMQLADAIGLKTRLPTDTEQTLSALFAYRNKMFHNGLEWPLDERVSFDRRITGNEWPSNWFWRGSQDRNGVPVIYGLTEEFIDHCLDTSNRVIASIGEFIDENIVPAC